MSFFSGFWNNLTRLFVPSEEFWTRCQVTLENKFSFIAGFNTAIEVFQNVEGQPLNCEFSFLGYNWIVDLTWYETHRLTIRSLSAALFYVLAFMKCFKMVSAVFRVYWASGEN